MFEDLDPAILVKLYAIKSDPAHPLAVIGRNILGKLCNYSKQTDGHKAVSVDPSSLAAVEAGLRSLHRGIKALGVETLELGISPDALAPLGGLQWLLHDLRAVVAAHESQCLELYGLREQLASLPPSPEETPAALDDGASTEIAVSDASADPDAAASQNPTPDPPEMPLSDGSGGLPFRGHGLGEDDIATLRGLRPELSEEELERVNRLHDGIGTRDDKQWALGLLAFEEEAAKQEDEA